MGLESLLQHPSCPRDYLCKCILLPSPEGRDFNLLSFKNEREDYEIT
jgi:hypothetical protein